jgi:polar amino acid transport system permease protein
MARSNGLLNADASATSYQPHEMPVIVPMRQVGRHVTAAVVVGMIGVIGYLVGSSQQVEWSEIPKYLFNPAVISGIGETIRLTILAMVIGTVMGTILAFMRMSDNPILRWIATGYVFFFRGVPLLVQIFFWFNVALFVPELRIGHWSISTNTLITAEIAGLLALSMHEAANMAEIVRNGFLGIDKGQTEACLALGLTPLQAAGQVILPQAIRTIIPPTGNQAIGMLKGTAIVSVIGTHDLLTEIQNTYARNYLVIELLFVAAIWYLVLTAIASVCQYYLERYFAHDRPRRRPPLAGAQGDVR